MSKVAWHGLARFSLLFLPLLVSFFPSVALGHQSSVVYLHIIPARQSVRVTLRIANSDLYEALALPVDPNRPLWDRHRRGVMRELLAKAESN